MSDKTKKLTCKQCGYVNEGERVYCHNCGTKLDRTLLPGDEKKEESPEKKQRRIRKIVSPSRGFFAGFGKTFLLVMMWAVLLAAVIQIARPPDNVPPKLKAEELLDVRPISMDLEDADQSPAPKKLTLTEAEINGFLQNTLKSKTTGLIGDEIKFIRAYVTLEEGEVRITTVQSIFDYPLYGSSYYKLAITDKKLVGTNTGGNFGRLAIHPKAMMYIDSVFQKLW